MSPRTTIVYRAVKYCLDSLAGLLTRHRDGRVHRLRANPQKLAEARAWIEEYARAWDASFDALDQLLAERHGPPKDADPTDSTE